MDIEIVGARTHNLCDVTCVIPHGAMTVITGVSGSGKSSLAFDTIYAEGQRRYVETLSTYARQFIAQMPKPPATSIRHVPPALALRQGNGVANARSTVATVSELADLWQYLYAGLGRTVCRACGGHVERSTVGRVVERLENEAAGQRVLITTTVRPHEGADVASLLRALVADGHRRIYLDGAAVDIDTAASLDALASAAEGVRVVIDRVTVEPGSPRLAEAVESAFRLGDASCDVVFWDRDKAETRFHDAFRCTACGTPHVEPIPALFDTASALGVCPTCNGYGRAAALDADKIVPNPGLSIADGALAPYKFALTAHARERAMRDLHASRVDLAAPWGSLPDEVRRGILGTGYGKFAGMKALFDELGRERYKPEYRALIGRFTGYADCEACDGSGLSADALCVRVGGSTLAQVLRGSITDAARWIRAVAEEGAVADAMAALIGEIRSRIEFLDEAGVGYLSLGRKARTLSGGELHRVLLATSVGRALTDTCYVLDEPTAGLHAHDTSRLMRVVERLRDLGNTVVVVEHDPDVIARADHIIELGPKGGADGGRLLYQGSVAGLMLSATPSGDALAGRGGGRAEAKTFDEFLVVRNVWMNNLRGVAASFPLRAISVVTGVSGSGKSSLVSDALFGALSKRRGAAVEGAVDGVVIDGDVFAEVIRVDQDSVATSSRSCPLTFCGAYAAVRDIFASEATRRGADLSASAFSFNVAGGRCERCEGSGVRKVELHFMADVELTCDECDGKRFQPRVLDVKHRGKSIADVFEMTVDEALAFFADQRTLTRTLGPLQRVGLGYVKLGQATSTMSGGELQRLKLASFIGQANESTRRLFIFDEPTVGLHVKDVQQLLVALRELVDEGDTVIVVEHNLDFVAACDWVVDLGPGAGPNGGTVVYEGRVASLVECEDSVTGRYLRSALGVANA